MEQAKITSIYNKASNPNTTFGKGSNANVNFSEKMDIDTETGNYHDGTSAEHCLFSCNIYKFQTCLTAEFSLPPLFL
jgi:hypothetical protein